MGWHHTKWQYISVCVSNMMCVWGCVDVALRLLPLTFSLFLPAVHCTTDSTLPCPGCWPCGLASASCCFARPRCTRRSSSTTWPGPVAPTFSPWVRARLCQLFAAGVGCETLSLSLHQSSQLSPFKQKQTAVLSEWLAVVLFCYMMIHHARSHIE